MISTLEASKTGSAESTIQGFVSAQGRSHLFCLQDKLFVFAAPLRVLRERKDGIRIRGLEKSGLRTRSLSLARCLVFANGRRGKQVQSHLALSLSRNPSSKYLVRLPPPSRLSGTSIPAAEIRELLLPRSRSSFTRTGDERTDGQSAERKRERRKRTLRGSSGRGTGQEGGRAS